MNARVRYAAAERPRETGPLVRLFRVLILIGVWILVGLAGLVAWARLTA